MDAYSIGSAHVPGLSKLIEEAAEVGQVCGKIMGLGRLGDHWDGSNLVERLEDEIADVLAAAQFVAINNGLDIARIDSRRGTKLALFEKWRADQSACAASDAVQVAGDSSRGDLHNNTEQTT